MYDVVKASYQNAHQQSTPLGKYGYVRDDALSNDNQQAYFNTDKKIIYSVTGTHELNDWGANTYLAAGNLKDTNRHKSADETLKKAKVKYGVSEASIYGHSLGGSIAGYRGGKSDIR